MDQDTPAPNLCRSSNPLRDRLDWLCFGLAAALVGDTRGLPHVAAEMARMGYGAAADNLAGLTSVFTLPHIASPPDA